MGDSKWLFAGKVILDLRSDLRHHALVTLHSRADIQNDIPEETRSMLSRHNVDAAETDERGDDRRR